ncbi:MAG: serine/threonine protein kinase [Verrucomicrobiales bacterium]|nr:serine/threonine protein kinase [Verrucomicrobiales bacterium]
MPSSSDPQSACLSDEVLRQLLDGEPHHRQTSDSAATAHLDACTDCRARLEHLAGADEVTTHLGAYAEDSRRNREITALLEPTRTGGRARLATTARTTWEDLAPFLDPSGSETADSHGRLGDLECLEIVGEGGMGVVIRARDALLEREVAVKILKPSLLGQAGLADRFFDEARAVASLSHENVVPIHQVALQRGLPYFVMPLVRGSTLECELRRHGPPPFPRTLDLCLRVARGLSAAHRAGLIHRDVKPDNVLIEARPDTPHPAVWLADFGLVHRGGGSLDAHDPTAAAGTPGYLAPEVTAGAPPDARADLYSLGALYQEIGGPTVPAWYRDLCAHLMAAEPDDRPESAGAVVSLLESRTESLQATSWSRRATARWLRGLGWAAACVTPILGTVAFLDSTGRTRMVNAALATVEKGDIEIEGRFGVFSHLDKAIAAARDGDTVVLHGPGPFLTGPIRSQGKDLTIAGSHPETPSQIYLNPHAKVNEPAFWWKGGASLHLRDVEIHHDPPAGTLQFTKPVPALIRIEGGQLSIDRGSLRRVPVEGPLQPIAILAQGTDSITLTDCLLHNTNGSLIAWHPDETGRRTRISLSRCRISGGRLLLATGTAAGSEPASLTMHLSDSRANLEQAFSFPREAARLSVGIHVERTDLQTRSAFFLTEDGGPSSLPQPTDFRITGGGALAHLHDPPVGVPGLDFPAFHHPGEPAPAWSREPIFVDRRWQRIGE